MQVRIKVAAPGGEQPRVSGAQISVLLQYINARRLLLKKEVDGELSTVLAKHDFEQTRMRRPQRKIRLSLSIVPKPVVPQILWPFAGFGRRNIERIVKRAVWRKDYISASLSVFEGSVDPYFACCAIQACKQEQGKETAANRVSSH